MHGITIFWFREDLRLHDNPGLAAAAGAGPVVPVYILDELTPGIRPPGGASRWWLHNSLAALDAALRTLGSRLILRRGPADREIGKLLRETGARTVMWSRTYDPATRRRDQSIADGLERDGTRVETHNARLLFEPGTIRTADGRPYRVFTPFWRACRAAAPPPPPVPPPGKLASPDRWPESDELDRWELLPKTPDWAGGLRETWVPGEAGAQRQLGTFIERSLWSYATDRDTPSRQTTSRLSPHLHFGEIGPRQVWHAVRHAAMAAKDKENVQAAEKFLSELGWREFSHALLYDNEELARRSLRPEFDDFPWRPDRRVLSQWQQGRTGFPIVDAGMRELWVTGWMHNRVRMVAASFLVKHLLQPWQAGEEWFWDTLVDADAANNAASWQWVAGCGADAAPFFRIFNPILQGERFDPAGQYVRRWVPELAGLPDRLLHRPWTAGDEELGNAGVKLGATYPRPIVDHDMARRRALAAFAALK